ncbi:MAG TPA: ABC transporter permease, partial [Anaerolineae bacterium]|nr:ABC transporter permease [Anaerolineae bacterium]
GSIGANKLRAALTMLGVIIGVGAVIALMALGNGVTESVTGEISSLGSNLISISGDRENSGGYAVLTLSDVEALSNPLSAPALSGASAIVQGGQEVVYGGESIDATVAGVTANYLEMNNMGEFQVGDGITQDDLDNKERVAVLGSDAALDLFGDNYALGKMVKVNGVSYEVVGILESQGSGFAGDTDGNIYVPITTAQTRLYPDRTRSGERAVSSIVAQTVSSDQTQAGEAQIQAVLRERHGLAGDDEDDFSLFSMTSLLDMVNTITGTLTAFLGAIAGISLLVGGIGIMNIMLVSVTERTREIGIRKAIGALKRDILTQFLLESVLLSVLGGVIGILLGWGLATAAGSALGLESVVDAGTVLLATGFAGGVGLVFGIYPAWRAASLQPIEALRYE